MASSLRELICRVTADTRPYQTAMSRASQNMVDFGRTAKHTGVESTKAWDMQTQAAKTHATALEASSQALNRYVGMAAGLFGAGKLIQMADDYGQISARIQNATASSAEFGMAQERLEQIASRTFRRYSEAADQFAANARPMQELGFSIAQTLDSAEALGLALVAGASDAQRSKSAMDAWSKSMADGRINVDRFQTLLQQTPRVAQALGDALGKTTGELQQMAREGQLTAQVVVPALISQMGKLGEEVDRMPTTVQDATNRFLDAMQKWAGGANTATGATATLVDGIALVTKHMDLLATAAIAGGIGVVGSKMILAGKDAVQMAQGMMQARSAQIALTAARVADAQHAVVEAAMRKAQLVQQKAFYAGMVAEATTKTELEYATRRLQIATDGASRANAAHLASVTSLTAAENANAAAKSRMAAAGRLAMGVFGGPAGLAMTVGAVAAGWLMFRDNADDATRSLRDMKGPLDEIIEKYRELGTAQQAIAQMDAQKEFDRQTKAYELSLQRLRTMGGAALYELFTEIDASVRAGATSIDEASTQIVQTIRRLESEGRISGGQAKLLIEEAAAFQQSGRSAQDYGERLAGMRAASDEAGTATSDLAGKAGAGTAALTGLAGAVATVDQNLRSLSSSLDSQIVNLVRIQQGAEQAFLVQVGQQIKAAGGLTALSTEQRAEYNRQIELGVRLIRMTEAAQQAKAQATRNTAAATREATKASNEAEKIAERRLDQYNDLAASQAREIALHGEVGRAAAMAYDTATGALRDFTDAQKESLLEGAKWLDWLDYMAMIDAEIAKTAAEHASRTSERFDSISVMADQAARNIQGHFADFLFNPFEDGVKGMVKGFSDAIRRMLAEAAAAQLFELIGAAMAGYGGQGTWGNFVRGMGTAMTTDGKRAGGGEVRPYSAYDVTEHGPELLQMGGRQILMTGAQGGIVSPLMHKAGAGGGVGAPLQVVVNNHGNNQVDAREERGRAPDGSMFRKLIIDVVAENASSGGAVAQALRGRYGLREAV